MVLEGIRLHFPGLVAGRVRIGDVFRKHALPGLMPLHLRLERLEQRQIRHGHTIHHSLTNSAMIAAQMVNERLTPL